MKKYIQSIVIISVMSTLIACGQTDASSTRNGQNNGGDVSQLIADQIAKEEADASITPDAKENGESDISADAVDITKEPSEQELSPDETAAMSHDGIDVDLTVLSSTMIYSEVYNMMVTPEDYVGKVVKMSGTFNTFHDDSTGQTYYLCVIQDATACCAQGMEFVLKDPEGYPNEGEEVTVVGTFVTYMEGEDMYCTLSDSTVV